MVINSNKTQIENEVEADITAESENSGKAIITNMLKRVTISRKQSRKFLLKLKLTHKYPHICTIYNFQSPLII